MKKRLWALFLTLVMACTILSPARADVMCGISVDGTYFETDTGRNESGDGWTWNAADRTLTLDGYYGSELSFSSCDDVTLTLVGENQLLSGSPLGLWVENSTLTIDGDGKLTAPFLAASESSVSVVGGTLSFTGSDASDSEGAGIYGLFSDFSFSGGTVFAGGKKYGMKLGLFSTLDVMGDSFVELYGLEAALVRMGTYFPDDTAAMDEVALAGLPTGADILGGNEANDRTPLSFSAVCEERNGEAGYVAALTAGTLYVNDVFADAPTLTGAAKRAYLESSGVSSGCGTLPQVEDLTWGKAYAGKVISCPVGLSWTASGGTNGLFHIGIYNDDYALYEGYEIQYVDTSNGLLGEKDGRYYLTEDILMELFLIVPRGESYVIAITNVSVGDGVSDSDPALSTPISGETVAAWLAERGYEQEGVWAYDEEDTTIPQQWRAYERNMEFLLDDDYAGVVAYALKDPSTGYETNYVRVRDIALWLDGTAAAFDVSWDGAVNLLSKRSYNANGTEMETPFGGTQQYEFSPAQTKVDGTVKEIQAILLKDANGNGYTYYKLRDLGTALGFRVDWSAEKGVFIETK